MYEKPIPTIDADSIEYWSGAKAGKLMLQYSKVSNEYFLYSRSLGKTINDENIEWKEVSGNGEIYSFTYVHTPAGEAFKDDVPYIVAIITLKEGARIISNVITEDVTNISIGDRVKVIFEKHIVLLVHIVHNGKKQSKPKLIRFFKH